MLPKTKKNENKVAMSYIIKATLILLGFVALIMSFDDDISSSSNSSLRGLTSSIKSPDSSSSSVNHNNQKNLLNLPSGTQSIILNIGSNLDPILPRKSEDGPCTVSIAFEPIVYDKIPNNHQQLHIVPAAVSYNNGLASMHVYNKNAVSSSLEKASSKSNWNTGRQNKGMKVVPIISMVDVIQSIPPEIPIKFLLTDMQGHDYKTIQAAIHLLVDRKVPVLRTEVYMEGIATYENTENDFCFHWLQMMNKNGYELVEVRNMLSQKIWKGYGSQEEASKTCQDIISQKKEQQQNSAALSEGEALWKLRSLPSSQEVTYEKYSFPVMKESTKPFFSSEEYSQCG